MGNGDKKFLGFFVLLVVGIFIFCDVLEDNIVIKIIVDGLINIKYLLKMGYWNNLNWLFYCDIVKEVVKFKDE